MLEYVFFDRRPFERFVDFVAECNVQAETVLAEELFEVRLPEELEDELSDRIEAFYEEMMAFNQSLYDREQAGEGDHHSAGVVVNLSNGKTVYANVEPVLLGRIMEVLTPEEFGDLVNAIVDAVESPDERSLCQRQKDQSGNTQ